MHQIIIKSSACFFYPHPFRLLFGVLSCDPQQHTQASTNGANLPVSNCTEFTVIHDKILNILILYVPVTLALVTLCTTTFIVDGELLLGTRTPPTCKPATPTTHVDIQEVRCAPMMASKREPEVIVFQEPTFKRRKKGREADRERERFLVSLF